MTINEKTGVLTFNTGEIDKKSLFICKSWLFDNYKRFLLTGYAKSKAQAERNKQFNAGFKWAVDMLATLEKYADGDNKTFDCWQA